MALTIKNIPVLKAEAAISFVQEADQKVAKRASVDFRKQVKSTQAILNKANMKDTEVPMPIRILPSILECG